MNASRTRTLIPALAPDPLANADEETLIEDRRATLRPAERVEQKLAVVLQFSPVLVSQMQQGARRPHDR